MQALHQIPVRSNTSVTPRHRVCFPCGTASAASEDPECTVGGCTLGGEWTQHGACGASREFGCAAAISAANPGRRPLGQRRAGPAWMGHGGTGGVLLGVGVGLGEGHPHPSHTDAAHSSQLLQCTTSHTQGAMGRPPTRRKAAGVLVALTCAYLVAVSAVQGWLGAEARLAALDGLDGARAESGWRDLPEGALLKRTTTQRLCRLCSRALPAQQLQRWLHQQLPCLRNGASAQRNAR